MLAAAAALPITLRTLVPGGSVAHRETDDVPDGDSRDFSDKFKGKSGRVLTRKQLFRAGMHEGGLEPEDSGYVFKGERFVPVEVDDGQ